MVAEIAGLVGEVVLKGKLITVEVGEELVPVADLGSEVLVRLNIASYISHTLWWKWASMLCTPRYPR